MTIRFYNPFARIRSLQLDLSDQTRAARVWFALAKERDAVMTSLTQRLAKCARRLDQHSQAVEHFMVERGELKDALTIADAYADILIDQRDFAAAAAVEAHATNVDLREALRFGETLFSGLAEEFAEVCRDVEERDARLAQITAYVLAAEATLASTLGVEFVTDPNGNPVLVAVTPSAEPQAALAAPEYS